MFDVITKKKDMRRAISGLLRQMDKAALRSQSLCASKRICSTEHFNDARTILAYNAIEYECDPEYLVEQAMVLGKRVAFPLCKENGGLCLCIPNNQNAFISGAFGIKEPDISRSIVVDYSEIDLIIVPAIAYDRACNRLGRGGGYYDRLLGKTEAFKAGLVFDMQIVDKIPKEKHDLYVDAVFTSNAVYYKD